MEDLRKFYIDAQERILNQALSGKTIYVSDLKNSCVWLSLDNTSLVCIPAQFILLDYRCFLKSQVMNSVADNVSKAKIKVGFITLHAIA